MRRMMTSVSAVAMALMIGTTAMAQSTTTTTGTTDQSGSATTTTGTTGSTDQSGSATTTTGTTGTTDQSGSATTTTGTAGTTDQSGSATSASGSGATTSQSTANDKMMQDKLTEAGVTNPQQVTGYIVTAQGPDGQPVVMVIGPENMQGTELQGFDRNDFNQKLSGAGFQNPTEVPSGRMLRGDMANNVALLVVGEPGWVGAEGTGTNATQPDEAKLKDQIGQAGIGNADQFAGQVLRVDEGGEPAFLIIGPSDFQSGQTVDVSSDEQSKLDQSGFSTMDMPNDLIVLQGKIGNNPVIIFTGPGLNR